MGRFNFVSFCAELARSAFSDPVVLGVSSVFLTTFLTFLTKVVVLEVVVDAIFVASGSLDSVGFNFFIFLMVDVSSAFSDS